MSDQSAQNEQILRAARDLALALESTMRIDHAALARLVRALMEQCK